MGSTGESLTKMDLPEESRPVMTQRMFMASSSRRSEERTDCTFSGLIGIVGKKK